MTKRTLLSLFSCIGVMVASQAQATDSFIVAHPDDWQLFMGEQAFDQLGTGEQLTFIYLNAGDGGYRAGGWGKVGYFKSRENGALASYHVASSVNPNWFPDDRTGYVTINGHRVWRIVHKRVNSYFLRLPDGAPDGSGYSANGFQSMQKLRDGVISSIQSVDGQSTYNGYGDLVRTVQTILYQFSPGVGNLIEVDPAYNLYNTHSDHQIASRLAMDAYDGLFTQYRLWRDYSIANDTTQLPQDKMLNKQALFGALCSQMGQDGYYGVYVPWHLSFIPHSSARLAASPYTGGGYFKKKK